MNRIIKIFLIIINSLIVISALLHDTYCYQNKFILCQLPLINASYFDFLAWIALISLPVVIISLFISDGIFKKWFKFALCWMTVTIIMIFIAPDCKEGILGFCFFDKENVSIWMSLLFVIISIIIFIFMTIKERRK